MSSRGKRRRRRKTRKDLRVRVAHSSLKPREGDALDLGTVSGAYRVRVVRVAPDRLVCRDVFVLDEESHTVLGRAAMLPGTVVFVRSRIVWMRRVGNLAWQEDEFWKDLGCSPPSRKSPSNLIEWSAVVARTPQHR